MTTNEEIVIEKNIPAPPLRVSKANIVCMLEIGDSFLTDLPLMYFYGSAKARGFKLTSKIQPDGKFRIWRVA